MILDRIAVQETSLTSIGDFNLTKHLPNDYFDMLVVDHNALQTVNVLNFVGDVLRQLNHAQQAQYIVRVRRAIRNDLTLFNRLTFKHVQLTPLRNQHFIGIIFSWRNNQALLAFGLFAERYHATDFCQD